MVSSTGNQPPFLNMPSKSHLTNVTKDTFFHFQHIQYSKSSGNSEAEIEDEEQIYMSNIIWSSDDQIYISYKSQYCNIKTKIFFSDTFKSNIQRKYLYDK